MDKILFTPIGLGSGLIAGVIGRKLFGLAWGLIDDQAAPKPEHRRIDHRKLIAALAIEGILVTVVRGLIDNAARHGYLRLTGEWPGAQAPEEE